MITTNLWKETPGLCEEIPTLKYFEPENKKSDAAIIILPGGGYCTRAAHEGDQGYAPFLASHGIPTFVAEYRVSPHEFPLPLLDARRAIRTVRYYADKYGIDKNKIAVMGSSAGGHLAALTSTYYKKIDFEDIDEIDKEDYKPNAQILCYPVIKLLEKGISHFGSASSLLGSSLLEKGYELSPDLIATKQTPQAFIWHTFDDGSVNVINSLDYARKLKELNVNVEMHIFPQGEHGLGLAPQNPHVAQWGELLINWLYYINYINK